MNDNGGALDTKINEDHDIPNSLGLISWSWNTFPMLKKLFLIMLDDDQCNAMVIKPTVQWSSNLCVNVISYHGMNQNKRILTQTGSIRIYERVTRSALCVSYHGVQFTRW
jgi:hypothetical protein